MHSNGLLKWLMLPVVALLVYLAFPRQKVPECLPVENRL